MTQVTRCVCVDILCCWAHGLLLASHHASHHTIILRESRPSSFDKIIHYSVLLLWTCCWLSVEVMFLSSFLCFFWCLPIHFHSYIIHTSLKISKIILSVLAENKGKAVVYKVYVYLKPQFRAFRCFQVLQQRQKLPHHILKISEAF